MLYDTTPMVAATRVRAVALMESLGIAEAAQHADELMALCEALLLLSITRPGAINPTSVLTHYLIGLGGRT